MLFNLHLSPPYYVLDHRNHIFSESLSSGDDNDRDRDLQKDKYKDKDTQTQTKTNTKCFQDPVYAIFSKSRNCPLQFSAKHFFTKVVHQNFPSNTIHQNLFTKKIPPKFSTKLFHQNKFSTCLIITENLSFAQFTWSSFTSKDPTDRHNPGVLCQKSPFTLTTHYINN